MWEFHTLVTGGQTQQNGHLFPSTINFSFTMALINRNTATIAYNDTRPVSLVSSSFCIMHELPMCPPTISALVSIPNCQNGYFSTINNFGVASTPMHPDAILGGDWIGLCEALTSSGDVSLPDFPFGLLPYCGEHPNTFCSFRFC